METRDEDPVDEALPGWVLRTPTRIHEVWVLPAIAVVVAAGVVVAVIVAGDVVARVAWSVAAAAVLAGAVSLAVAGTRAYRQQSWGASWDLHRTTVLVAAVTGAVVLVASLIGGGPIGVACGALVGLPAIVWSARSVTRFDRQTVAVTCTVVATAALVLVVLGLTIDGVHGWRATVWTGPGAFVGLITAVAAIVQLRSLRSAAA